MRARHAWLIPQVLISAMQGHQRHIAAWQPSTEHTPLASSSPSASLTLFIGTGLLACSMVLAPLPNPIPVGRKADSLAPPETHNFFCPSCQSCFLLDSFALLQN